MPWKEEFISQLSSRGVSATEFELPDSPSVASETLGEIEQWWNRLDTPTKAVIRSCGSQVAYALSDAGFTSLWSNFPALLDGDQPLPAQFNHVVDAWNAVGEQAEEHINDEDYDSFAAIKDAKLSNLSDF